MSIAIGRYNAEGPFSNTENLQARSGVYVIICRSGGNHRVIDVGESGDIRSRIATHERGTCWRQNCSAEIVAAAIYCDQWQRKSIERELRNQFRPACGLY